QPAPARARTTTTSTNTASTSNAHRDRLNGRSRLCARVATAHLGPTLVGESRAKPDDAGRTFAWRAALPLVAARRASPASASPNRASHEERRAVATSRSEVGRRRRCGGRLNRVAIEGNLAPFFGARSHLATCKVSRNRHSVVVERSSTRDGAKSGSTIEC